MALDQIERQETVLSTARRDLEIALSRWGREKKQGCPGPVERDLWQKLRDAYDKVSRERRKLAGLCELRRSVNCDIEASTGWG